MTGHDSEALVQAAWAALGQGDIDGLLEHVDPDLSWTFLDPSEPDPQPATCHGREQLRTALRRQASQGLAMRIEEITAHGDQVLVVLHRPGLDRFRAWAADDRNYMVVTVAGNRITALRACRDRAEARAAAGLTSGTGRTAAGTAEPGSS
jgi:ketosteroid isomerase-like protein